MRFASLTWASTNLRMHHWMHLELGDFKETWLQTLFDPFDVGPAQEDSLSLYLYNFYSRTEEKQRYS